jgi:FixJ family two-component response regulator
MPSRPVKLVLAVIDDDEDIRRALRRLLCSCGHDVHVFDSAEEYLTQDYGVDCIILDVQLPGLTGLELEGRMRQQGTEVPVVFISGQDDPAIIAAVRSTHRSLLRKPFDEDLLLDAIAKATEAHV